jgi:hypothetical protein
LAILQENVPSRYAYGTEGIIDLLSGIDNELVDPRTLLGIGRIPSKARDTGPTDPLDSRHVVVVFDSEQTAERLRNAVSKALVAEQDPDSTLGYLVQRGCKARTM